MFGLLPLASATTVHVEPRSRVLPVDGVFDLAVDDDGWVWASGPAGVFRIEGEHARRWGVDSRTARILTIAGDRALVLDDLRRLAWLEPGGEDVVSTDDLPGTGVPTDGAWVGGTLWVLRGGTVYVGGPGGWREIGVEGGWLEVGGDRVAVGGSASVVELGAGGERIRELPVANAATWTRGSACTWIVDEGGVVWRFPDGGDGRKVAQLPAGLVTEAVERQGRLWVAQTSRLVGVDATGQTWGISSSNGVRGAVALVVDHEGALWAAQPEGLTRIPSPETRIWTDSDGLPETGGLTIDAVGGRIWVTSWSGPAWIEPDGQAHPAPYAGAWGEACRDGLGHTWAVVRPVADGPWALARLDEEGVSIPLPPFRDHRDCSEEHAGGGIWLGFDTGLYHVDQDGAVRPTGRTAVTTQLLEDARGELWAANREGICHARAADVLAGTASWTCDPIAPGTWIADIEEVDGDLWATTAEGAGVLRHGPDGWSPLPGAAELPSHRLSWMSPSPRGGVWISGHGLPFRARPDPGSPDGWKILEELGSAQGLRSRSSGQVLELADGTLWLTADGVYRIPAEARRIEALAPTPELVHVMADGREETGPVTLAAGRNLLELRFAVPSGRGPDELAFRVRTGAEAAWSGPSSTADVRFVDLPPGQHTISAQASVGRGPWSAPSSPLTVTVPPPWWRSPSALVAWSALLAAALVARRAARRALALRLEEERQRIAMDLHDEVGSGLASLALLAGMASEAEMAENHRLRVAGEAARLAGELGEAIHGLVAALRRDAGSPDSLVRYLRTLGERRFPMEPPAFHLEVPRWFGGATLALPVRRQVQQVAAEALHNAARHADATNVWVRLAIGDPWTLVIEDDGKGLGAATPRPGGGNGLDSMRARAKRIGGTLTVGARNGGGTRIELRFTPRGRR